MTLLTLAINIKHAVVDAQQYITICNVTNRVLRHNNIVKLYFSEAGQEILPVLKLWMIVDCKRCNKLIN